MNTETKLYPFRLEEAKQNKGNVVTRDGKSAVYIGGYGDVPWPHEFRVSDSIRPYRYTSKGRFYSDVDEDSSDLFMTTPPEDKPAPPKAVEEVASSIIDRLDSAYHRVSSMAADGRGMRMSVPARPDEDDDLVICGAISDAKKAITTAEQEIARLTRERDEARKYGVEQNDYVIRQDRWALDVIEFYQLEQEGEDDYFAAIGKFIKALKSRTESAEAQLAEVRRDAEFDRWYSRQPSWVQENNDRAALKLGYEAGQASREGGAKL